MGIPNMFALAQVILYIVTFILSFFVCVPAGVNVDDFNGHCLLYASGDWTVEQSGPFIGNISWGQDSACNFTIFIGVMSLMMALFYSFWTSILLARGMESSWLDSFLNLIVNSAMSICIFSTALTVSVGFHDWCELITDAKSGIERCEDGQYRAIFRDVNIQHSHYFTQWQCAQFGIWFSWMTWLILAVMSLVRMYNFHRQEAFSVSINRERQRLLQKVGHGTEQA
ncbi:transmembrane protein 179 [Aplysia californica]|uniref:Transmembrane protein 179 n=1 Tax=Aplysia californica TaxID=6500 RepID=A0ABM0K230_APLCA|nr:transmembrane protein 179 [Aplysia californica]